MTDKPYSIILHSIILLILVCVISYHNFGCTLIADLPPADVPEAVEQICDEDGNCENIEASKNAYYCKVTCTTPVDRDYSISAAENDAVQPWDVILYGNHLPLANGTVGLRFTSIDIPRNQNEDLPTVRIDKAYIQFTSTADTTATTGNSQYVINGELSADPPIFEAVQGNLTGRPPTTNSILWYPGDWFTDEAGPNQQTEDISEIIQEIITQQDWQRNNDLVLLINGLMLSYREAYSYEGSSSDRTKAPQLIIEYTVTLENILPICMTEEDNPHVTGVWPSDDVLLADIQNRVNPTVENLPGACEYPGGCTAELVEDSEGNAIRITHEVCDEDCPVVHVVPDCSNLNPLSGNVSANAIDGYLGVCVAEEGNSPSGLAAQLYGLRSLCAVSGTATLGVEDEFYEPTANGIIEFRGLPCTDCAMGVTYRIDVDDVAAGENIMITEMFGAGGTAPGAVMLNEYGQGDIPVGANSTTFRAQLNDEPIGLLLTNATSVPLEVNWEDRSCAFSGSIAGTEIQTGIDVQGELVNQPPYAIAFADAEVECNCQGGAHVLLDGRASSDPDDNILLFSWIQGNRAGDLLGYGSTFYVDQTVDTTQTYVLRVIDTYGQSHEDTTQEVTVVDTTPPSIICPADATVECDQPTNPSSTGVATATDICDPLPNISFSDVETPGSCPQEKTITRTWTATDASGNSNSCVQLIGIVDTTPPVITLAPDITIECDESTDPINTGFSTATDSCDAAPTVAYTDAIVPGSCPEEKIIIRTWTANDNCGNSTISEQIIEVVDTTAPIISFNAPATIIPPDAPISFTATATDNCDLNPSTVIIRYDCYKETKNGKRIDKTESCVVSIANDTITILDSGGVNTHIEWVGRATDGCENVSEETFEIQVVNPNQY